jgi:choline-glycine betaine transporter
MLIVSLDCSFLILFFFCFSSFLSCAEEKQKKNKIKNEQSRDSINIEHKTRTKKNKRKTKSRMNNPETQSTLSTRQERRKTKEKQNQE